MFNQKLTEMKKYLLGKHHVVVLNIENDHVVSVWTKDAHMLRIAPLLKGLLWQDAVHMLVHFPAEGYKYYSYFSSLHSMFSYLYGNKECDDYELVL